MEHKPKRIYIVGPSGSGKTTLGELLCEKLNIPHISLDDVAYPNQQERSVDERLEHVSKLASQDKWLTEGIYLTWTKRLLDKADLIIWLDLPYSTTLLRVIKRFFVHKIRGDEKYGFKNTLKFIWNLRKYYYPTSGIQGDESKKTTRALTKLVLKNYQRKVVRTQNIKQFFSRM